MSKINIAIDGPSGAGKSTISDLLAKKLGYIHLDTGAMYRTVAFMAIRNNIGLDDEDRLVEMIRVLSLNRSLMEASGAMAKIFPWISDRTKFLWQLPGFRL